ncbi:MAG: cell wall-associated NlpC family hydrolase [Gammaproteobacteria bacterium]|jgi:cell wall-associated NlpC family hydrolase
MLSRLSHCFCQLRALSPAAFVVVLVATILGLQSGCAVHEISVESVPASAVTAISEPSGVRIFAPTFDVLGLIAYATSMQGKPYRIAGDSPRDGFDCSGLVYHVYRQFSVELPRTAASMAEALPSISLADIEAADLLFFDTQRTPNSHVGIYLGDGRFVHAPSLRTGRVIISDVANSYWKPRLSAARRPTQANWVSLAEPN